MLPYGSFWYKVWAPCEAEPSPADSRKCQLPNILLQACPPAPRPLLAHLSFATSIRPTPVADVFQGANSTRRWVIDLQNRALYSKYFFQPSLTMTLLPTAS